MNEGDFVYYQYFSKFILYYFSPLFRSQCLHGVFGGGAETADADRQDGDKQYCQ
jgi:hypothetical protein